MAQLINVHLSKGADPSWGFRLQGGKDFGTPLVVQKVNVGSPAERAGLVAGDSVIKINNIDVFNLRHKDAQDVIVRAGPSFEMSVQRGGSTWKPAVTPTNTYTKPQSNINNVAPVTKTSLAATRQDNIGAIGTGHNVSAKPFSAQVNGAVNGTGPKLVNKQYNSPLNLYSEESIAETLSAQAEVLSPGVLGVNFKKNEKNFDASTSAVLRMVQEADKEPKQPEPVTRSDFYNTHSHAIGGRAVTSRPVTPQSDRSVSQREPHENNSITSQQEVTKCTDCERVIVGVFVRIKDKNLHVECFKCATCGTSLKNVGYYNINNKLYCDIHAKLAARNNPPAANLIPVTVPPGGRAPANAISSALSNHPLPSPGPLSPSSNTSAAPFQAGAPYSSGPRPFSSVSAPLSPPLNSPSTFPRTAPLSPKSPSSTPFFNGPASYSTPTTGQSVQNLVWPPPPPNEPDLPTATPLYFPPPSQREVTKKEYTKETHEEMSSVSQFYEEFTENVVLQHPRMSLCSSEVSGITDKRSAVGSVETLAETLDRQMLIDTILRKRPPSPPPIEADVVPKPLPSSETNANASFKIVNGETLNHKVDTQSEKSILMISMESSVDNTTELKRPTDYKPNTVECHLKKPGVENSVPQQWVSPMVTALTTAPDTRREGDEDAFSRIPIKRPMSSLASALAVAPSRPFTPITPTTGKDIPLPEYVEPYLPPEHEFLPVVPEKKKQEPKSNSQFVKALQIAPERPFTPTITSHTPKKKRQPEDELLKSLPKPERRLTMREALETAPDKPFPPFITDITVKFGKTISYSENEKNDQQQEVIKSNLTKPLKPAVLPASFHQNTPSDQKDPTTKFPPISAELKSFSSTLLSDSSNSMECSIVSNQAADNDSQHDSTKETNSSEINQAQATADVKIIKKSSEISSEERFVKHTIEKQAEKTVYKKPLALASSLRPVGALPQYQKNLSENVEMELLMLEKAKYAQAVQEQASKSGPPKEPVIKIQINENKDQQTYFCPVNESKTPSIGSRSVTPSMINKPPRTLPYYQENLVAQEHLAPDTNIFDPKSPAISRSPSPCPERSSSPFCRHERAKSPAPGPPPNPLRSTQPVPTPEYFRKEDAKQSVTKFIPKHKEKENLIEMHQTVNSCRGSSQVQQGSTQQFTVSKEVFETGEQANLQLQVKSYSAASKFQQDERNARQTIHKECDMKHTDEERKLESTSTHRSQDGLVQIERKRTVTEEIEHTHKSATVQIQTKSNNLEKYPFRNVAAVDVSIGQGIVGLHVTNPQPIQSTFLAAEKSIPLLQKVPACDAEGSQQSKQLKVLTSPCVPKSNTSSNTTSTSTPIQKATRSSDRNVGIPNVPTPHLGVGGGRQAGAIGVAPKRGRGILNTASLAGSRVPLCGHCHSQIRGPFITALGKIWCPEHFTCSTPSCRRPLQDLGFVEEHGQLYCEYCFEQYLAPPCSKCSAKIKADCLKAIGKNFHPECFNCSYCGKLFGNSPFFLEDGLPYCENDWNELFTTKCFACGFPVEAGDRWVEALNNNYHSQCFNCTMCKKNLEGQSFFAKGGRPFCKNHAR